MAAMNYLVDTTSSAGTSGLSASRGFHDEPGKRPPKYFRFARQIPGIRRYFSGCGKSSEPYTHRLQPEDVIPVSLNEMFAGASVKKLLPSVHFPAQRITHYSEIIPPEADRWSPLRKIMYYRTIHTLPVNMLVKVDRMSMANSLEVRAPFLDPDLFDASASTPGSIS